MTRYLRPLLAGLVLTLTACAVTRAHGAGWPGERNPLPAQSARSLKWEALK